MAVPHPTGLDPLQMMFWPFIVASETVAAQATGFARLAEAICSSGEASDHPPPETTWTTPNHVRLDLQTMRLRDFSAGANGVPALVCTPFVLHDSGIADFAPGHSVVETLLMEGCQRLFVTDWRSATPSMRLLSIDNYLAELNAAIDEIGPPVDLIGLCQGGVIGAIYAARFPGKIRKLVLAASPIDTDAAGNLLSAVAQLLPLGVLDEVVDLGNGRLRGQQILDALRPALGGHDAGRTLQIEPGNEPAPAIQRFQNWYEHTVDLPGVYCRQLLTWLFKENRLARGRFEALGLEIDLGSIRQPLFMLAAEQDEFVPAEQLMGIRRLVGTDASNIEAATEQCSHLALFMGRRIMQDSWRRIACWLREPQRG